MLPNGLATGVTNFPRYAGTTTKTAILGGKCAPISFSFSDIELFAGTRVVVISHEALISMTLFCIVFPRTR